MNSLVLRPTTIVCSFFELVAFETLAHLAPLPLPLGARELASPREREAGFSLKMIHDHHRRERAFETKKSQNQLLIKRIILIMRDDDGSWLAARTRTLSGSLYLA